MAAWSHKTLKKIQIFCIFWKKTTPYGKIFKFVLQKYSSWHRSMCYVQISWNKADGKLVKSSVIYLTKNKNKISPGSPALATKRILPKICHGQPRECTQECSRFHPNQFTFGRVISEYANTIKMGRKVFPIFDWSLPSSEINITCTN